MIYEKNSYMPLTHNRYEQAWEYMFVLAKGRPRTWNPIMVPSVTAGTKRNRGGSKQKEDAYAERLRDEKTVVGDKRQAGNVFSYDVGKNEKTEHNAPFLDGLASDHIISWSNPFDIVLDPFSGSGTTCKAAKKLNRMWCGVEINPEYCKIAERKLRQEYMQLEATP